MVRAESGGGGGRRAGGAGTAGEVLGPASARCRHLVDSLPHPLHLMASLTGTAHYHFGDFLDPGASFAAALDQMVASAAAHLPAAGHVLDVGCGLGGATRILARRGLACLGIDPCAAAIDFARATAPADAAPRYEVTGFLDGTSPVQRFEGVLFLEVLQHLPALDLLLERSLALTAPGATLVFSDLFLDVELPWRDAPFHRREALAAAAARHGFAVVGQHALPERVLPTIGHLLRALDRQEAALIARHQRTHRDVRAQIRELAGHCEALGAALANGDATYQIVVLRRP